MTVCIPGSTSWRTRSASASSSPSSSSSSASTPWSAAAARRPGAGAAAAAARAAEAAASAAKAATRRRAAPARRRAAAGGRRRRAGLLHQHLPHHDLVSVNLGGGGKVKSAIDKINQQLTFRTARQRKKKKKKRTDLSSVHVLDGVVHVVRGLELDVGEPLVDPAPLPLLLQRHVPHLAMKRDVFINFLNKQEATCAVCTPLTFPKWEKISLTCSLVTLRVRLPTCTLVAL